MTTRWLLTTAAALAVTTTALAGCGGDDPAVAPAAGSPPPTAASSATGTTAAGPTTPDDTQTTGAGPARFVAVVRDKLPEVAADRRDEEITTVAEQACRGLSEKQTADEVVAQARSLGTQDAEATDHATARELVKLAIDTVCPDQAKRVDEF